MLYVLNYITSLGQLYNFGDSSYTLISIRKGKRKGESMPMNDQSPWGKKKKPGTPEDFLAALIQKIRDSFNEESKERPPSQKGEEPDPVGVLAGIGKVALIVLAIICFQIVYSSFYTIEPGEQGIVMRFGKYHRTTEPGLRFKMPYIEDMEKVDVTANNCLIILMT